MKTRCFIGAITVTLFTSLPGSPAFADTRFDGIGKQCYAQGMIGLDSVINSRVGVNAEDMLHLARVDHAASSAAKYSRGMLMIIYDAYFWEDHPYGYAMRVFHQCVVNQGQDGQF